MIVSACYIIFWPIISIYKIIRQSIDTWARLYLYTLLYVYNTCGIHTEFDSKIESETTKSLRGFPSFLGFGGTDWWNDAIQKTWIQLSLVATDKILAFLNTLFTNISSTSNLIESLTVNSIFLGSKAPLISNIKISSFKHIQGEDVLRADFHMVWKSSSETSKIVIEVQMKSMLPVIGKTNVSCFLSDFHVAGNMRVDMHPIIAKIPPFQNMSCCFIEKPTVSFKLKFKDTAVGSMKVGHSKLGMGFIVSRTLKQKIIDDFCKGVVHPSNIVIKL